MNYFGTTIDGLAEEVFGQQPLNADSIPTITAAQRAYAREVGTVNAFIRSLGVDASTLTEAADEETWGLCGLLCAHAGWAYLYPARMPDDDGRAQGEYHRARYAALKNELRKRIKELGESAPTEAGKVASTATPARRNERARRGQIEPSRLVRMISDVERP